MLNPFPLLLAFGLFAPLLLRIILGVTLIHIGGKSIRENNPSNKFLGVVEIVGGSLLVVGMFTQIVALLFVLILGFTLLQKMRQGTFLSDGVNYYLILFVIALSLLFSGAGFFAIDYPL